jgi:hypothetical protein
VVGLRVLRRDFRREVEADIRESEMVGGEEGSVSEALSREGVPVTASGAEGGFY